MPGKRKESRSGPVETEKMRFDKVSVERWTLKVGKMVVDDSLDLEKLKEELKLLKRQCPRARDVHLLA